MRQTKELTSNELQILLDLINAEMEAVQKMKEQTKTHEKYMLDLLYLKKKVQK